MRTAIALAFLTVAGFPASFDADLTAWGDPARAWQTHHGTLQGVAVTADSVYVSTTKSLARYDAGGNLQVLRDTRDDPLTHNGGIAVVGDELLVSVNNYPMPWAWRSTHIARYDATTLDLLGIVSPAPDGRGSSPGLTVRDGDVWWLYSTRTDDGIAQQLWRINATTWRVVDRFDLAPRSATTDYQDVAWYGDAVALTVHGGRGRDRLDWYGFGNDTLQFTHSSTVPTWGTDARWLGSERGTQGLAIAPAHWPTTRAAVDDGRGGGSDDPGGVAYAVWFVGRGLHGNGFGHGTVAQFSDPW